MLRFRLREMILTILVTIILIFCKFQVFFLIKVYTLFYFIEYVNKQYTRQNHNQSNFEVSYYMRRLKHTILFVVIVLYSLKRVDI